MYDNCKLCPNMCGVDRTIGQKGVCMMGDKPKIAWSGLHRGEEPPISGEHGSGMIFFTGCTLHCQYCQNIQISGVDGYHIGFDISNEELAELMLSLEAQGAATINLVTGTHFIPSIVEALKMAKAEGLSLPIVWNSSGYERPEALALIDPYIDIYLLDCKSLSRKVCSEFCGTRKYADWIEPVMDYVVKTHPYTDLEDEMRGTVLRHLVFPGTIQHTHKFIKKFGEKYKDAFTLSLMVQFVPPKGDVTFPAMTDEEYDGLFDAFEEAGIEDGFIQDRSDDDILWIPDFRDDVPFPENFCDPNPYFLELKHKRM